LKTAGSKAEEPPITVAIFDLDDTLYDCFRQRVVAAHRHAARAMVRAGVKASVEQVLRARMKAFRTDPHLHHIDGEICRRFGVRDRRRMMRLAREAYFSCPVGKLALFRGTRRVLRELHGQGVRLFVVTFGNPRTQREKVRALGLDREPAVEAIYYADTGNVVTKEAVFRRILRRTKAPPGGIVVVGDRPSGEIRAGKELGMHTVRLRRGEFASLEPRAPAEKAEFQIQEISRLLSLPLKLGVTRD
jgi:putative hydrolase of the HAD superfamily